MIYEIKRGTVIIWSGLTIGKSYSKIIQEDRVEIDILSSSSITFKKGDTITVYGKTYKLNRPNNISRVHNKYGYTYNIEFEAPYYDLGKWTLYTLDKNNELKEPEVYLMGDASVILGLIIQNANRASSGWTLGEVDQTDVIQWAFSSAKLLTVLQDIVDKTNLEFWFDNGGKRLNLTRKQPDTGVVLEYGKGKGLCEVSRARRDKSVVTHLTILGGSQNIPNDYGFRNIQPTGGNPLVNPNFVAGMDRVEETLVFDNIYPRLIAGVTAAPSTNVIRSSDIDFNLNDNLLDDGTSPQIAFTSGQLNGFKFTISDYDHTNKQVTFNIIEDDKSYPGGVPNAVLKPAVGDKFVFLNIDMPSTYVVNSENRVKELGDQYFVDEGVDQYEWSGKITPKFALENEVELPLGGLVTLKAPDLGFNGKIRIDSLIRDLQEPHLFEFTLSNIVSVNSIVREKNASDRLANTINKGITSDGLTTKATYAEKAGYAATAGHANTATNAATANFASESQHASTADNADHSNTANHANHANTANHADTADYAHDSDKWDGHQFADYLDQPVRVDDEVRHKSLSSPTYTSGATGHGFKINADGSAEFDSLSVRKELNVVQLNVREITGTGGSFAVTNVAKISSVVDYTGFYRCYINTDGGTIFVPFVTGDIIRCQVWDGQRVKYYTAVITSVGVDFFDFDKSTMTGGGIPTAGDAVFQWGSAVAGRQGLIYMTNSDTGAPYLDVLDGVTSPDLAGKTKVRLGKLDGITDSVFGPLSGYGFYGQRAYIRGSIWVEGGNAETVTGSQNKADNAYSNAIAFTNTQFQVLDGKIEGKVSSTEVETIVNNKVDNIQVGGRNLLRYSNTTEVFALYGVTGNVTNVVDINQESKQYIRLDNIVRTIGNYVFYIPLGNNPKILNRESLLGQEIVVSFRARANSNFILKNDEGTAITPLVIDTTWRTYAFKITTDSTNLLNNIHYNVYGDNLQWMEFTGFKVEKGNKYTDWTLAPEDEEVGSTNTYSNKLTEVGALGGSYNIQKNTAESPNGFIVTGYTDSGNGVRLYDVITEIGWWTVSGFFRGSQNVPGNIRIDICDKQPWKEYKMNTDNSWTYFEHSVYVNEIVYKFVDIAYLNYVYYFFKNIKVEKGNKATAWSQSPKDIEQGFTDVNSRVTNTETLISQNSQQILLKASKEDFEIASKGLYDGDFENGLKLWSDSGAFNSIGNPQVGQILNGSGANGGNTWRVNGYSWIYSLKPIPVIRGHRYRLTLRYAIRQASTTGSSVTYCGFAQYHPDGSAPPNVGLNYFVSSGSDINNDALNTWHIRTGEIVMDGVNNGYDNISYIKVAIGFNYGGGNAIIDCDSLILEDITQEENSKVYTNDQISITNEAISLQSTRITGLDGRLEQAEIKLEPDNIWLGVEGKVKNEVTISNDKTQKDVSLLHLDPNTSYPVIISLDSAGKTKRITVRRALDSGSGVPPYSIHSAGFSFDIRWTTNGSGWGSQRVYRNIEISKIDLVNESLGWGNIAQNTMASEEVIYLRGGSKYTIILEGSPNPNDIRLYESGYWWDGGSGYTYSAPLITYANVTLPEVSYQTKENIKSGINIGLNGVDVFGKQINLNGIVTIQGSNAQNAANAAQGTANAAQSSANTANSNLSALQGSLGSLAYDNAVTLAKLDSTIVEGGYIKTNLINANEVFAQNIYATGMITATNLTVTDNSKIGSMSIDSNGFLYNNNAQGGMMISGAGTFAAIGPQSAPATLGLPVPAWFESNTNLDTNFALVVMASGATDKNVAIAVTATGNNPYAIEVGGGLIKSKGHAYGIFRVTGSNQTIPADCDVVLINTNALPINLYLPTYPKVGQAITIKNLSGNDFNLTSTNGSIQQADGSFVNTNQFARKGVKSFMMDGNYWVELFRQ